MKVGGYMLQDFERCDLPKPLANAFDKLFDGRMGGGYKPVLYCATQVVNGINHLILCEVAKTTNPPIKSLETVVINIPFDDETGEKAEQVFFEPQVIVGGTEEE